MTKKVTFSLPEEALQGTTGAKLLGDFNQWDPAMAPALKKQKDGNYKVTVSLEEGKTYQYRFLLDDGRWENDYHAQHYEKIEGLGIDNSVITVPVSEKKAASKKTQTKSPGDVAAKKTAPKKSSPKKAKSSDKKAEKAITSSTKKADKDLKKSEDSKEVKSKRNTENKVLKESPKPKK